MTEEIQKFLSEHLGNADFKLEPIKKGGSDRSFFRICLPDKTSFIFMHYGTEVEENAHWVGINKFISGLEISVPQIVAQDIIQHFILLEDLGDVDLWSQRALPWDKRRDYYFQVLTQIRRLHAYPLAQIPADLKLSESYGPRLYSWEHDYFLENLVREVSQINPPSHLLSELKKELDALSTRLQKIEPCLIHRDFQSQNIMIKNGRPVLIDFQGMREGCLFYDLGSLVCDPYVTFTAAERGELINFYYELMGPAVSRDEFINNFWEASAQRLMQALGAYGFLGLKKNKPAFLNHIDNGLANLLLSLNYAPKLAQLKVLVMQCQKALAGKKH
jgi:aminoglycoside/choline kinase family phosphotransferase